jgi:DNA-binding GntR family transcriptional regulator
MLSDKAYEIIRNAIVFHELKPTDVLTEERLSEELSISRTPIRTALHRLVDEGLAEVRGKSITVSSISDDDILNVSRVRIHLELMVMEELQGKVTDRLIANLRETIARQTEAFQSNPGDYIEYIRQDYLFHTILARATDNKFLLDLTERINTHSTRCLMLIPNLPYAHNLAVQEHTQITDSLEQLNYDKAYRAMKDHLAQILVRFRIVNPDRSI